MRFSSAATFMLLFASAAYAQQAQNYALDADSFIAALLKVAAQFQQPMGVEWIKTADTLKPVRLSRSSTSVADIMDSLVATQTNYAWRNNEDGVIHVFRQDLALDSRNPLNIIIGSFDPAPETAGFANAKLAGMVSNAVQHPGEARGIALSVLGYPGEPVFSFAAQNVPARAILNKIVAAGLGGPTPRMHRVWIATFPENPVLNHGYLESAEETESQPLWILMPWGDPPRREMLQ